VEGTREMFSPPRVSRWVTHRQFARGEARTNDTQVIGLRHGGEEAGRFDERACSRRMQHGQR